MKNKSYPKVVFPDRSFGHIHLTALWPQVLIERLIQNHTVNEATAYVKVSVLAVNVERDVLPLWIRQIHILKGHNILRSLNQVDQIQSVGTSVGQNLELSAPAGILQSDQGSPGALVLSYGGHKHKTLIVLNLLQDLMEGWSFHSGDVVKADETVRRWVPIVALEELGTNRLSADAAGFEKVEDRFIFHMAIFERVNRTLHLSKELIRFQQSADVYMRTHNIFNGMITQDLQENVASSGF